MAYRITQDENSEYFEFFFFFNSSYEAFSRLEIFANLYVSNLPARRTANGRLEARSLD